MTPRVTRARGSRRPICVLVETLRQLHAVHLVPNLQFTEMFRNFALCATLKKSRICYSLCAVKCISDCDIMDVSHCFRLGCIVASPLYTLSHLWA